MAKMRLNLDREAPNRKNTTLKETGDRYAASYSLKFDITYDVVVLAAYRRGTALALTNANHGDRGAIKANKGVDISSHVDEIEDGSQDSSSVGLLELEGPSTTSGAYFCFTHGLSLTAALDWTSGTLTVGSGGEHRTRGDEGREEEDESENGRSGTSKHVGESYGCEGC